MSPLKLAEKALEDHGFVLRRHGRGHDIWFNPSLRRSISLKRHDFNDNDLKYILKEISALEKPKGAQQ